jgi:SRP-independent targeting protein 2/TMEM208
VALLNRTHIITLSLHVLFLLLHFLFNRPSALLPYALLAFPALAIEFYLERLGRPRYSPEDGSLKSAGEDLGASGLTEYMWDITYWTWGCMVAVCLFNNRAWWLYLAVPVWSVYLAWTTFFGIKNGLAGMGGGAEETSGAGSGASSKRQQKLEKRGGQRVQYR